MFRCLFCTAVAVLVASNLEAADLVISVYPVGMSKAGDMPECVAMRLEPCATTLSAAIGLVEQPGWQGALAGRYETVRLQLAPGTYRVSIPLLLHWDDGNTHGIPMEIVGAGPDTILSGAVPVRHWQRVAIHDFGGRIAPAVLPRLWVAEVAGLGLPLDAGPPPRGFGVPIRPVQAALYQSDSSLQQARWPNMGYAHIERSADLSAEDKRTFLVTGRASQDWSAEPELMVHAYWFHDWAA